MRRIKVPSGLVFEFPDGTTDQQISAYLAAQDPRQLVADRSWGEAITDPVQGTGAGLLDQIGNAADITRPDAAPTIASEGSLGQRVELMAREVPVLGRLVSGGARAKEVIGSSLAAAAETLPALRDKMGLSQIDRALGAGDLNPALREAGEGIRSDLQARRDEANDARLARGEQTLEEETAGTFTQSFADKAREYADAARANVSDETKADQQALGAAWEEGIGAGLAETLTSPADAANAFGPDIASFLLSGMAVGRTLRAAGAADDVAAMGAAQAQGQAAAQLNAEGARDAVLNLPEDKLLATPMGQALLAEDRTPEEIRDIMARRAGDAALGISSALNAGLMTMNTMGGLNPVDRALAAGGRATGLRTAQTPGLTGRAARALEGGTREFMGEAIEGGADQLSQNLGEIAGGVRDPGDAFEGVGTAAVMEGTLGAPIGGITGLMTAAQDVASRPTDPAAPDAQGVQDVREIYRRAMSGEFGTPTNPPPAPAAPAGAAPETGGTPVASQPEPAPPPPVAAPAPAEAAAPTQPPAPAEISPPAPVPAAEPADALEAELQPFAPRIQPEATPEGQAAAAALGQQPGAPQIQSRPPPATAPRPLQRGDFGQPRGQATGYAAGVPALQPGQNAKAYLKQNIDTLPDPTPAQLPTDTALRYFSSDKADAVVPLSALRPSKRQEAGNAAIKRMAATAAGVISRRDAIDVADNGDGTYRIVDGNGSYAAAAKIGLKDMPVRIVEAPAGREPWRQGRGLLPPEADEQLTRAYEQAAQEEGDYRGLMNGLAESLGGEAIIAPLKGRTRSEQKAVADYGGDVSRVADILRGTLVFEGADAAVNAANQIRAKLGILKDKDSLSPGQPDKGFGYRDINLVVQMPGGAKAEIQLMTRAMADAKAKAHKAYEVTRVLQPRIDNGTATNAEIMQYRRADAEQRKLYLEAETRSNAATKSSRRMGDQDAGLVTSTASTPEMGVALPAGENLTPERDSPPSVTNANTSESLRSMNATLDPAGGMVTPSNTSDTAGSSTKSPDSVQDSGISRAVGALLQKLGISGDTVRILRTPKDLPEGVPFEGLDNRTEGIYHEGKVYLFADQIGSPARAIWVTMHEFAGHLGLRALLPADQLAKFLDEAGKNETIRGIARAMREEAKREAEKGAAGARVGPVSLFIEEALAEFSAAMYTGDLDPLMRRYGAGIAAERQADAYRAKAEGIGRRLIRAVKKFAFNTGAPMSDADVATMLAKAGVAARGGTPSGAQPSSDQRQSRRAAPEAERPERSSVGLFLDPAAAREELGLKPTGNNKVRDVAAALNARAERVHGKIAANDRSEESAEVIAEAMADEIATQLGRTDEATGTGLGWYSSNFPSAVRSLSRVYPELENDAGARNMFTALLAVTSNGEKVKQNLQMAMQVYGAWREGGRLVDNMPGTRRAEALRENLEVISALEERFGYEGMQAHLLEEMSVAEINAELRARGETPSSSYTADMRLPRAALYFGPKLGAFYANLAGAEGYLTMDLWWSRSFNRYRGNLIPQPTASGIARVRNMLGLPDAATDEEVIEAAVPHWESYKAKNYKGGTPLEKAANTLIKAAKLELNEAPENASDRRFMYEATRRAQSLLEQRGVSLSIADIQAALWYYEKRLYAALGVKGRDDIGYEEAIRGQAAESDRPVGRFARGRGASGRLARSADAGAEAGGDARGSGSRAGRGRGRPGSGRPASGEDARAEQKPALQSRLPGAPSVPGIDGPDPRLVQVAESYARSLGIELRRQSEYAKVDPERAARIADAYEAMPHAPQDPRVRRAYADLIRQTTAQYRALEAAGYRFWFIDIASEQGQDYAGSPWNAMRDLRANQSMGVFPTLEGFGSGASDLNVEDNPLLADTGIRWPFGGPDGELKPVLANDLFRAVHDAFGHGLEGAGFRARGEENAWQAHVRLFTGDAVGAITSETRGQNSWLNYGPFGESNRTAQVEDTVFADQKTGLMPSWTWTEGRVGDMPAQSRAADPADALSDDEIFDLLEEHGRTVDYSIDAEKAFSEGDLVFINNEMSDGEPYLAQSIQQIRNATTDNIMVVRREDFERGRTPMQSRASLLSDMTEIEVTVPKLYFDDQFADRQNWEDHGEAVVISRGPKTVTLRATVAAIENMRDMAASDADRVVANRIESISARIARSAKATADAAGKRLSEYQNNPRQSRAPDPQTQTPEFKRWFGDSKVVDADGKPLVVFHGTKGSFDTFDAGKQGQSDFGASGRGFYFSQDLGSANLYANLSPSEGASNIMPVYVSLQNPYEMGVLLPQGEAQSKLLTERLKEEGYDGIIVRGVDGVLDEIVAFRSEQIKSATGNRGTFDPANPNITQSRSPAKEARQTAAALRQRKSQLARDLTAQSVTAEQMRAWTNRARLLIGEVATSPDFSQEIADAKRAMAGERRELLGGDREALRRYDEARDMLALLEQKQAVVRAKAATANRLLDKAERRAGSMSLADREALVDQLSESLDAAEMAYIAAKRIADWRAGNDAKIIKAHRKRNDTLGFLAAEGYQQGSFLWSGAGTLRDRAASVRRKIRRLLQDKLIDLRDVQREIEAQLGRTLDDLQNVYRAENQMHGKVADGIERFRQRMVEPLKAAIVQSGIPMADVERYLWAKHAPERNARIAQIRPGVTDGSGMTNDEAAAVLASFTPEQIRSLEGIGRRAEQIRRHTLETLVEAGQLSREQADTILGSYEHYVPLRGRDEGETRVGGTGTGISAGRAGIQRALGRKTPPRNILAELVGDGERAIVQSGKAEVGRSLLRLVLSYPNPDLWNIEPVVLEPKFSEATGEVYLSIGRPDDAESVIVKHNGKPYRVVIKHPELVAALRNTGLEGAEWVVRYLGKVNRWFSAVFTRFNPGFVPVNLMRDALQGLTGVAAELGSGSLGKVVANYPEAMKAAFLDARSQRGDASRPDAEKTMADWTREFAEAGGKTGWTALDDADTLQADIENSMLSLAEVARRRPLDVLGEAFERNGIIQLIEHANDAVENAIRIATYAHLRKDKGWSRARAAEYAKEMTVNFNRKGAAGSIVNALYLFYNAGIQGSRRTLRLLSHPRVAGALGGVAMGQFALAAALGMQTADEDDEETLWDQIPDYVKRRNFVIPLGFDSDKNPRWIQIPMPFGFNVFPAVGSYAANYLSPAWRGRQESHVASAVGYTTSTAIDALSPIAVGEEGGLWPTIVKLGVDLARNRDDLGRRLRPSDEFIPYDAPRAGMANPGTPQPFIWAAKALNRIGGGDDYHKPKILEGLLDVSPNDLEYLFNQFAGGPGNTITGLYRAMTREVAADDARAFDIPVVKSVVGGARDESIEARRYYNARDRIERNLDRLRDAYVAGGPDAFYELRSELGAEYADIDLKRRKRTTENGNAGDVMADSRSGRPQIEAPDGSLLDVYRDTGRSVQDINAEIRRVFNDRSISPVERQRRLIELQQERAETMKPMNRMVTRADAGRGS